MKKRPLDLSRLVAIGDGAGAPTWDTPGPIGLWARKLGVRLVDLSESGSTSQEVIDEQLDVALALRPTTTVVSLGVLDTARELRAATMANVEFLRDLLLDTELLISKLRSAGSAVILIRPLALASTPAAWSLYGELEAGGGDDLEAPLERLACAEHYWRTGLQIIARMYDAQLVDFSRLIVRILAGHGQLEGREVGLPPESGSKDDLFADASHLSPFGASLAADLLLKQAGRGRPTPVSMGPAPNSLALA